jgi:hypothetical protein
MERPFDLHRALNGEPVRLRCGYKAYIHAELPNHIRELVPHEQYTIIGSIIDSSTGRCNDTFATWTDEGKFLTLPYNNADNDIIGMWDNNGKF